MKDHLFGRLRAGTVDQGLELDQLPRTAAAAESVKATWDLHRKSRVGLFDVDVAALAADADQPRRTFDDAEIEQLAASLQAHGQQTPLIVRFDAALAKHIIVHGEKRWRAACKAGLATLACVVDPKERRPQERKLLQVVEALHRGELSPVDRARAFREIMGEHGWNGSKLADELRINHGTVSRALALLDVDPETQASVDAGETSARSAITKPKKKGDEKRTSTRTYSVPGGTAIFRLIGKRVPADRFAAAAAVALTTAQAEAAEARVVDDGQRAAA